jgi:hypothetical protein
MSFSQFLEHTHIHTEEEEKSIKGERWGPRMGQSSSSCSCDNVLEIYRPIIIEKIVVILMGMMT